MKLPNRGTVSFVATALVVTVIPMFAFSLGLICRKARIKIQELRSRS